MRASRRKTRFLETKDLEGDKRYGRKTWFLEAKALEG
jgi:hypothetical protein